MKKLRTLLWMSILFGLSTSLHAQQVVNAQDSLALVAIYNNTNGPRWNNSWDLSQPVTSWQGIDVNGNGQVSVISLPENNLRGTFEGFDIANQLTGLQSLNIADNFITAIPNGLPPSLQSIDISLNRLSLQDVSPIRAAFPNLNNYTDQPQKAFGPNVKASAIIGDSVQLVVEADNSANNTYTWFRPGSTAPIQQGPSNILRIPRVSFADSGFYNVQLRHGAAPNFIYNGNVNVRLIVNPTQESHESARDSTGRLRAILRLPPDLAPARKARVRSRLAELGITLIAGESCLCDEFSLYYFPESFLDSLGDVIVGPVSLLTSACGEVEAVGGGTVQLGYDYLVDESPSADLTGPKLNIQLEASLDMTNLAPVKVAVIDLGIDKDHPDLAPFITTDASKMSCMPGNQGYNFFADNDNPYDVKSDHGTHVAGIITSFIPDLPIELMSIQVGQTGNDTRVFDLVCGIRYAALQEADLINLSMGYMGPKSELLADVIESLQTSPVLTQMIAAAGNNGKSLDTTPFWPAAFAKQFPQQVLAVSSMNDSYDALNTESNYSGNIVRLAAPGTHIRSTINDGKYGLMSGTSMAAPFVTALFAHPIAQAKALSPGVPPTVNLVVGSKDPAYSVVDGGIGGNVEDDRKIKVSIRDCNDAPLAVDDAFSLVNGQNLTFDVRHNDCFGANTIPSIVNNIPATDGQLTVNADGTISFVPAATDKEVTFTYEICSAGAVCSQAEVSLSIGGDTATGNYWWWIILILIIMILLAYFLLRRNP